MGSLSLMALAAANEAVPPPTRTYWTLSVIEREDTQQTMRFIHMIETHTDRPGRGIEGGGSGGGVTGSSSAVTALSDGVSCSSATAEGERRERR